MIKNKGKLSIKQLKDADRERQTKNRETEKPKQEKPRNIKKTIKHRNRNTKKQGNSQIKTQKDTNRQIGKQRAR